MFWLGSSNAMVGCSKAGRAARRVGFIPYDGPRRECISHQLRDLLRHITVGMYVVYVIILPFSSPFPFIPTISALPDRSDPYSDRPPIPPTPSPAPLDPCFVLWTLSL